MKQLHEIPGMFAYCYCIACVGQEEHDKSVEAVREALNPPPPAPEETEEEIRERNEIATRISIQRKINFLSTPQIGG